MNFIKFFAVNEDAIIMDKDHYNVATKVPYGNVIF